MEIKHSAKLGHLVDRTMNFLNKDAATMSALNGMELSVGFDNENGFGIPAHAPDTAIFAGDEMFVGFDASPAAQALMAGSDEDKARVQARPVFVDPRHFKMQLRAAGDAGFDPLAGQMLSPWNITYINKVWKEPLAFSNYEKLVHREHGASNPFAEFFTLYLEQYAGWGVIGQTGSFQNTLANDVNVVNGMATFPIINMMGTYSITTREKHQSTWGPFGGSPVARKQQYLEYVFSMMEAILALYGDDDTNTKGLLNVVPQRIWPTGKSIKDIYNSTSATKGADIYKLIAEPLIDMYRMSDGKYRNFTIGLSPNAYALLRSMPYSDVYNPAAAVKVFLDNWGVDEISVQFVTEPLLKANMNDNPNPCNPNDFDLMTITVPSIGGGPKDEKQSTNFICNVLDKFVFPVIPGMYNDQYKALRRTCGLICPVPSAVRVYAGFGQQD